MITSVYRFTKVTNARLRSRSSPPNGWHHHDHFLYKVYSCALGGVSLKLLPPRLRANAHVNVFSNRLILFSRQPDGSEEQAGTSGSCRWKCIIISEALALTCPEHTASSSHPRHPHFLADRVFQRRHFISFLHRVTDKPTVWMNLNLLLHYFLCILRAALHTNIIVLHCTLWPNVT